jgi:hypothetical protein
MTAVLPSHTIGGGIMPGFSAAPRPWLQLYGVLLKPPPAYLQQVWGRNCPPTRNETCARFELRAKHVV